jgi:hypothetical protein
MALDLSTHQKTEPVLSSQVSSLRELAKTIHTGAVARALGSRRTYASNEMLLERELSHPASLEGIKDSLALGVARALAAQDAHITKIYTYDPSGNADNESGEDPLPDATIHLLAVVTTPTAALRAFIAALDGALTESLKGLPSPAFQQRESILDVNLLTQAEIQQHKGYSALLTSVFAPPIPIWSR